VGPILLVSLRGASFEAMYGSRPSRTNFKSDRRARSRNARFAEADDAVRLTLARDDEQKRTVTVLHFDESESAAGADRAPVDSSLSSNSGVLRGSGRVSQLL
jgi:hypothetical protein